MVLPAPTGSGLSTTVTPRSANADTNVFAVALLLPATGSVVVDDTVAVFESTVPLASAAPTLTTSVRTALPAGIEARVQLTVPPAPTAGVVQLQPPGFANDTNVVPAGSVSDTLTAAALLGPALVTVMVYVRLLPATTGSGVSTLVTDKSADAATAVVAVALLLALLLSPVFDVTVAVLLRTVPAATDGATAVVSVNTALPTANDTFEQDTVPVAPTAGVVQDQPATAGNETKVVPAGSVSLHDAVVAASGPLLVTVIV